VDLEPGQRVRVEMTKWGDRAHWEFDAYYLGTDEHGDWCGVPAGTSMSRPGARYVAPADQVCLVPADNSPAGTWFLAAFHGRGGPVQVYVDMTTPADWDGAVIRAIDLDLDVVRGLTGRVWVDDEDEFAEHRVSMGYPDRVVREALDSCQRVQALLERGGQPFDGRAQLHWLEQVADLRP
jgi:hypothetical protein